MIATASHPYTTCPELFFSGLPSRSRSQRTYQNMSKSMAAQTHAITAPIMTQPSRFRE
jgi:hypothetical protein